LEKRRIRGDLIQVFRIVRSCDRIEFDELFKLDDGGGHVFRSHNWKLRVKRCRLQVRKCFFTQRIINVLNKLPEYVVESSSVVMFKKRLDDWSIDVELSFAYIHYQLQVTSYKITIMALCKSLVRPHLEYCTHSTPIWSFPAPD